MKATETPMTMIASEVLVPWSTRLNTSCPTPSVPMMW